MIFIAGVSPKTTILDPAPRLCPVCGLARARMQRVDQWLSLFFIPVFRVKTGDAFLFCDRCDRPVNAMSTGPATEPGSTPVGCAACGRPLEKDHRYCPYCGQYRENG